jgi:hypothetical protein
MSDIAEAGLFELSELQWIQSITELDSAVWSAFDEKDAKSLLLRSENGYYSVRQKSSDILEIKQGASKVNKPIEKQSDDIGLLAAAALGYKVSEITKETDDTPPEPEKISSNKIKAKILKADDEERFVLGVVLEPFMIDKQEDVMIAEDIRKTAHTYLREHRVVGYRHKEKMDADVVESYLAPVDFEIDDELVKRGSWLLGIIINDDESWQAVKDEELNGFSVGGFGEREELT